MQKHVTILSWLHIVVGILLVMVCLLAVSSNPSSPLVPVVTVFLVAFGLPILVAGVGMLHLAPWGRVFGILVAVLGLLTFNPICLVWSLYSLYVLTNSDTVLLFKRK